MKLKSHLTLAVIALLALAGSGCASRTATLGAGAVLGGVVGKSVGVTTALSGAGNADAVTGSVLGVVLANEAAKNTRTTEERIKESYLQGQRDARVEASAEYWNAATYADGSHPNLQKNKAKVRQIQSDPAFIEGVKYGGYYVPAP